MIDNTNNIRCNSHLFAPFYRRGPEGNQDEELRTRQVVGARKWQLESAKGLEISDTQGNDLSLKGPINPSNTSRSRSVIKGYLDKHQKN